MRPFKHADILWEADKLVGGTGDEQAYRAVVGDHMLFVVEMSDAFLADQPAQFPRVSWSVITGEGWEDTLVGGAAPDIPVAKARAEALWRALLGQKQA